MAVTVRIPAPLRSRTGGASELLADGGNVAAVIAALDVRYPGFEGMLIDDKGVRRFVNLYVGGEDIRYLDGLTTQLDDGDELNIVAAYAGG